MILTGEGEELVRKGKGEGVEGLMRERRASKGEELMGERRGW